ncbi:MAG: hypothetical protein ACXADC_01900 [Candidatus Thorarchaeota archaeon]|jgi:hypothetical protein
MPWPYEEYTLFENILGMVLLQLTIILGYFLIKFLLFMSQDSIEESADAPDEEYWDID